MSEVYVLQHRLYIALSCSRIMTNVLINTLQLVVKCLDVAPYVSRTCICLSVCLFVCDPVTATGSPVTLSRISILEFFTRKFVE
jgi:hypothetical protein